MTGCPNCSHIHDPHTLVARTSCPHCQSPLRNCGTGCPYPISEHHDPHCSARGYSCVAEGQEVFRSPQGILHHHEVRR